MSKTKNHYWWNNLLYRIKINLHLQSSQHRNLVSSTLSWNLENHFQMGQNRTPEILQTFLLSVKADLVDLFLNCSAFFLTAEFLSYRLSYNLYGINYTVIFQWEWINFYCVYKTLLEPTRLNISFTISPNCLQITPQIRT